MSSFLISLGCSGEGTPTHFSNFSNINSKAAWWQQRSNVYTLQQIYLTEYA